MTIEERNKRTMRRYYQSKEYQQEKQKKSVEHDAAIRALVIQELRSWLKHTEVCSTKPHHGHDWHCTCGLSAKLGEKGK